MSYFKGPVQRSSKTIDEVLTYPILGIPDRKLRLETCEHFGIRTEYSVIEGRPVAHYFPVTKKGKITGFVCRKLGVSKKQAFSTIGDVTVESDLLGQDKCATGGKKIFVVEGVYDYPSAWQVLRFAAWNKDNRIPNVVSIGLGTKNAAQHIGNNLEFINGYENLVTCFDNDAANDDELKEGIIKGQDAVREVALLKPNLLNVVLKHKDASDYLQAGEDEALNKALMFDAKPYVVEHIVTGGIGVEKLLEPIPHGVFVDVFPKTMNLLHGLRPGELTVILAPAHVGKTTFCKEIGYGLVKSGKHVGHIFLEEEIKKTQQSYIAIDNNVYLPKFRENPGCIPFDKVQASYNELIDNGRTEWMAHFGSLSSATLMQKLQWMHIKGCQFGLLDHLSMVISGQESNNERKDIDMLLTEIKAFTVKTQMHWIVVSHIKRIEKFKPKDKKYPYWMEVDVDSGRGSGAFEQLADNIIIIEPQITDNGSRGLIRTKIGKNREWGWLGVADVLQFDHHSGRPIPAVEIPEPEDE